MAVRAVLDELPVTLVLDGDLYCPQNAYALDSPAKTLQKNLGTPLNSMKIVRELRHELTPGTEQLYGQALLSIVKPGYSPNLMEESDAKDCLKYVAGKVVTRAEKRKAEAAAAAAAEEARNMEMGAQRAAKRAAVASRPVPTVYWVDNALRPRAY